jgi:hypothetical protein
MEITILSTAAALDDGDALGQFLSNIPNGDQLGKLLQVGKSISTRAYDDDTGAAHFVESDGKTVRCFTVTDITIDQAEMIAAQCLGIDWGDQTFREAVEIALGP